MRKMERKKTINSDLFKKIYVKLLLADSDTGSLTKY